MASPTEIKLYLERARTALQQSRDNLNLGYYDVASSRAYYAMFYAATALLLSQGILRSKHSGVHSAFDQHFVKPGLIEPEYGRMLFNAFNVRLDSHYEVYPAVDVVLAENVLRDSQQFVDQATTYLQSPRCDVTAKSNLAHLHLSEEQALAEFVQMLQEQFASLVHLVLLFGSKARGDFDLSSDLNVLVVVDSDDWRLHKQIRYLAADICLKYDLNLSPRIWSVSHFQEMEEMEASLYQNIRRDGLSLLEHNLA